MPDFRTPRTAVAAMFVLNGGLFGIWASRIPAFVTRFELSADSLGLLLLCLAAGAIISFPLAGHFSDRIGAASLTRRIAVLYVVALVLLATAPSVGALAACLTLFGFAHGAMDVAMNGWGAEVERHLARPVMSSFHAMFSLGAGAGAASGYLAVGAELAVLPHFLLVGAVFTAFAFATANQPWASERSASGGVVFAFPRGALLFVGIVAFAASLGEGAMADWSAVFLDRVSAATEAQTALGYVVYSIAMVVTRLAGDRVVHRLGEVSAARLSGSLALFGILTAMTSSELALVLLGFMLMGTGYALVMPLAFSRAAADGHLPPGRAIAGVATLGYGGMLLGLPVIGFVAELSTLRAAFGVLALLAVVVVLFAASLDRNPGNPGVTRAPQRRPAG